MTVFWNSPELLSTALRYLTFGIIALPAILGAAIYFVNDRIGAIQAEQISQQAKQIGEQDQIVKSLKVQAEELTLRSQNAERGISDTYDFNGGHRQTSGARRSLTIGAETSVFQTMIALSSSKDWQGLEDVCERQIQATPTWLTPYYFSGIASANLGDFAKAKERLQFVVSKAGNDPDYADATRVLADLKAASANR
jgi:hypothetical protein